MKVLGLEVSAASAEALNVPGILSPIPVSLEEVVLKALPSVKEINVGRGILIGYNEVVAS